MSNRYAYQPKGKGYTIYRTRTGAGASPKSRSKGTDGALGGVIIGLSVVVGIIWAAIKLAVYLLAVILGIAAVVLAVVGIRRCVRAVTAKWRRRQECLALVSDAEPAWEGTALPVQMEYISEDEKRINQSFHAFLEAKNAQLKAEKHLSYLRDKQNALEYLKRDEEAAAMQSEINIAAGALNTAREAVAARRMPQTAQPAALRIYQTLVKDIRQNADGGLFGEFLFRNCCAIPAADNIPLILTPSFAVRYDPRCNAAKLIPYSALMASSDIRTELLEGMPKADEEVAFTCWQYEKKDGGPDLRYRDNRLYTYVYRGTATIGGAGFRASVSFNNQSKTVNLVDNIKALAMAACT